MQEQRKRTDGGLVPQAVGIVVAAGRATRYGPAAPKQFLELAGLTVRERAVLSLAASSRGRGVVVVLAPEEIGGARAAAIGGVEGVISVVGTGRARGGTLPVA